MENGQSKDYVTSNEAASMLGYTSREGVHRFLKANGSKVKQVGRPGGGLVNTYPRTTVVALGKKYGKLSQREFFLNDEPKAVEGVEAAGSILVDDSPEKDASSSIAQGKNWLTREEAAKVLGYISFSGAAGILQREKISFQTTLSRRGRKMYLYRREEVEALKSRMPPPRGGLGKHRKNPSLTTDSELNRLNEVIASDTVVTSNDPVLTAIQLLFVEYPRLLEVSANRVTGNVKIVFEAVTEAKL